MNFKPPKDVEDAIRRLDELLEERDGLMLKLAIAKQKKKQAILHIGIVISGLILMAVGFVILLVV